ncbi:MAG: hypothetical protein AAF960_28230 [Bacteroidota bacterium]
MAEQQSSIIEKDNILERRFSGELTITTSVNSGGKFLTNIFSQVGRTQNLPTPFTSHAIGQVSPNNREIKIDTVNYSFDVGQKKVDFTIEIKENGQLIKTFHNEVELTHQTSVVVFNTFLRWPVEDD